MACRWWRLALEGLDIYERLFCLTGFRWAFAVQKLSSLVAHLRNGGLENDVLNIVIHPFGTIVLISSLAARSWFGTEHHRTMPRWLASCMSSLVPGRRLRGLAAYH